MRETDAEHCVGCILLRGPVDDVYRRTIRQHRKKLLLSKETLVFLAGGIFTQVLNKGSQNPMPATPILTRSKAIGDAQRSHFLLWNSLARASNCRSNTHISHEEAKSTQPLTFINVDVIKHVSNQT